MDEPTGAPELFLFLASTVHDMKNSLSVVSGTLEKLLQSPQPCALARDAASDAVVGAPQHVALNATDDAGMRAAQEATPSAAQQAAHAGMAQMLYQTKRMNDKLIQLLALYKQVGRPAYPFDAQPHLLSQLVEQVAAQEKILLAAHGITLETACPNELIWCFDEDLLIGVLGQAINNAIRYTRDRIRLSVTVHADAACDMLEIRIDDNGDGYSAALIEDGASAMSGLASGVNFSTNSTGLGLYFSSAVAQMHKHRGRSGAILLENGGAFGGGCFVLRLP